MPTIGQIKAARALLEWNQEKLALASGLSVMTIRNIERNKADPKQSTIEAINIALENAGIEFIPENGGGSGVRLKHRSR